MSIFKFILCFKRKRNMSKRGLGLNLQKKNKEMILVNELQTIHLYYHFCYNNNN